MKASKSTFKATGSHETDGAVLRPRKYRNQPVVVDGRRFDSKREATRYLSLLDDERAGKIKYLQCQPRYPLRVNGVLVATYVADFRYLDIATNEVVLEDVKSQPTKTPVYRLKKRLVAALYGTEIREVS